jgi:hypothetical protein
MAVESAADRESFFEEDEFATCVETPAGNFFGNFNDEHANVQFEGAEFGSSAPSLECRTADAERYQVDKRSQALTINGVGYTVREHRPDGSGISLIILDAD